MIIVSACLLGVNCRYDGKNCENKEVKEYLKDKNYVLVCPEQLGGLSTPRLPSELKCRSGEETYQSSGRVVDSQGRDVTKEFIKGAEETLKIARIFGAKIALLKSRSPSCGSEYIYSGDFDGKLKKGMGVTASLLKKNGILILSEENFHEYEKLGGETDEKNN